MHGGMSGVYATNPRTFRILRIFQRRSSSLNERVVCRQTPAWGSIRANRERFLEEPAFTGSPARLFVRQIGDSAILQVKSISDYPSLLIKNDPVVLG